MYFSNRKHKVKITIRVHNEEIEEIDGFNFEDCFRFTNKI